MGKRKTIVFDLETSGSNGESIIMIGEKKGRVIHLYDPEKAKAITEHGQKLVREMMAKMPKIKEYESTLGNTKYLSLNQNL